MINAGTILLSDTFSTLATFFILFFLWRRNRFSGTDKWAWSILCHAVALLLMLMRGTIPDLFSIVMANGLMGLAIHLLLVGTASFFDRKLSRLHYMVSLTAIVALLAGASLFTYVHDDLNARIIQFSALISFQMTLLLLFLHRMSSSGSRGFLTALKMILLVFALTNLLRVLVTLVEPAQGTIVSFSGFPVLAMLSNQISSLVIHIILILLINERQNEALSRANSAIKKSEILYRSVVDNSPSGISIIDKNRRLVFANAEAERQLGRSRAELATIDFEDVIGPNDVDRVLEIHRKRKAKSGDIPTFYEATVVDRLGRHKVLEIYGKLLSFQDEDDVTLVQTVDITRRKEDERKLEEYSRGLEKLVEERTRELLHVEKLSTIGVLASGLAHEINNPNNYILLNAYTLKKGWKVLGAYLEGMDIPDAKVGGTMTLKKYVESVPEALEDISEGATRIERILSDLRDLSSLKETPVPGVIDINDAVEKALLLSSKYVKQTSGELRAEYCKCPLFINADLHDIEHIVLNLVQNSCNALEGRGGLVNVTTGVNKNCAFVEVHDNGCGIPEENLGSIFDPFFTTRRDCGGSGLGLSVVSRLVTDLQGDILVDSEPGTGTSMTVKIPLIEGDAKSV